MVEKEKRAAINSLAEAVETVARIRRADIYDFSIVNIGDFGPDMKTKGILIHKHTGEIIEGDICDKWSAAVHSVAGKIAKGGQDG